MRNDPYYKQRLDTMPLMNKELEQLTENTAEKYNQRLNTSPYESSGSSPEQKIMQKLALLDKEMNKQPEIKSEDAFDKSRLIKWRVCR
ncbi:MAG: hypothetical protein IPH34_16550 [Chitinophagaceae bacterium]|nr:hypothetical protein [Chitinophagaceae bacterium]